MKQLKGYRSEKAPTAEQMELTEKYDGMNQDQLYAELMSKVAAAKREGEFSESMLDDFVAFVSPNLDASARAKLDELVRTIKNS